MQNHLAELIQHYKADTTLYHIGNKIINNQRITPGEALYLYHHAPLGLLGTMADYIKHNISGNQIYYIKNIHIEPTNICSYQCKFCSYSRQKGESGSFERSMDEILEILNTFYNQGITEVHIVGGAHPDYDIYYFRDMLRAIRNHYPGIFIKALTAVEIDYLKQKSKLTTKEALDILKESGLDAIPGGGAEIFTPSIRRQICPAKTGEKQWLEIHKTAHQMGIASSATMLYGHIENYEHRIDHMEKIRQLQDETRGFQVFIPLKYRNANNSLTNIGEASVVEDLKNFAIARIFLDNIPHLKAYWPMLGLEVARTTLNYGVDDLDGTVLDSTQIYSMAGMNEINSLSPNELEQIIYQSKHIPVERDTFYEPKKYTSVAY